MHTKQRFPSFSGVVCLTALLLSLAACQSAPIDSSPVTTGTSLQSEVSHQTDSAQAKCLADQERLQGVWRGKGPGGGTTVTIDGDALHFESNPEKWWKTTFTIATTPLESVDTRADESQKQIHATIDSYGDDGEEHVGKIVVALYKLEGEQLTLGVVDDYEKVPDGLVGDWDWIMDIWELEKVGPQKVPDAV